MEEEQCKQEEEDRLKFHYSTSIRFNTFSFDKSNSVVGKHWGSDKYKATGLAKEIYEDPRTKEIFKSIMEIEEGIPLDQKLILARMDKEKGIKWYCQCGNEGAIRSKCSVCHQYYDKPKAK